MSIDGGKPARIEAVLFMKESPLAAENMRVFCSGGRSSGAVGAHLLLLSCFACLWAGRAPQTTKLTIKVRREWFNGNVCC